MFIDLWGKWNVQMYNTISNLHEPVADPIFGKIYFWPWFLPSKYWIFNRSRLWMSKTNYSQIIKPIIINNINKRPKIYSMSSRLIVTKIDLNYLCVDKINITRFIHYRFPPYLHDPLHNASICLLDPSPMMYLPALAMNFPLSLLTTEIQIISKTWICS